MTVLAAHAPPHTPMFEKIAPVWFAFSFNVASGVTLISSQLMAHVFFPGGEAASRGLAVCSALETFAARHGIVLFVAAWEGTMRSLAQCSISCRVLNELYSRAVH